MNTLSFSVYVESPILRAALDTACRAHGIHSFALLNEKSGADLTIDDLEHPVRLGGVMDYLIKAAKDQMARLPDPLHVPGGVFTAQALFFVGEEGSEKTDQHISMTGKETALIRALYHAPGQFLSRSALLSEIWGYVPDVESHTLETHIYRLRQKIETDKSNPRIILTAENGYRLNTGE